MSTYSANTHQKNGPASMDPPNQKKKVSSNFQHQDSRKDHLIQRQLIHSIHGTENVVQLKAKEAREYINQHKVGLKHFFQKEASKSSKRKELGSLPKQLVIGPTVSQVRAFIADQSIDLDYRKGLVDAWNHGRKRRGLAYPTDLTETVDDSMDLKDLNFPSVYLNPVMSPTSENYDGQTEDPQELLSKFTDTEKLYLVDNEKNNDVRIVNSFTDMARIIRADQNKKSKSGEGIKEHFFVKKAGFIGLAEKTWKGEYAFRCVKSTEDQTGYQRDQNITPWKDLCNELQTRYSQNFSEIVQNIHDVLTKEADPMDYLIFEVAGAMICDCKYSIQGALLYMNDILEKSGSLTNFNQIFGSEGIYEPVNKGGRQKVKAKRDNMLSTKNQDKTQ